MTLELTATDDTTLFCQLEQLHHQMPDLFKNTPVVLALNHLSRQDLPVNFSQIKKLCKQFSINAIAIKGGTREQQLAAVAAGLAVFPDTKKATATKEKKQRLTYAEIPIAAENNHTGQQPALIIDTPVRSGQQIYHAGDIIITSSVSTGAEVLASGNIHIYNTLRGRALAGVNGNKNARIFCQQFEAELVSICGHFKPITSTSNDNWQKSVQIYLQDQHFRFKTL